MTSETEHKKALDIQAARLREERDYRAFLLILQQLLSGLGSDNDSIRDLSESAKPEEITESRITAHPLFYQTHQDYRANTAQNKKPANHEPPPKHFNDAASGQLITAKPSLFSKPDYIETAMRTAFSIGIENYTEDCKRRGVKYGFGVKDGASSIDCSGFVEKAITQILVVNGVKQNEVKRIFTTHSDGQVLGLAKQTGMLLQGKDVNASTLKAGMVLGIDSGDKKWDRGRSNMGIDHIGVIYADSKTGKLMFAESRGGVGVMTTPLEEYLKTAEKKGHRLFAADVTKLATEEHKKVLRKDQQLENLSVAKVNQGAAIKPVV